MRICSVENCNKKYNSNGYCKHHARHIRLYGEILTTKRKVYRQVIYFDTYAQIELTQNKEAVKKFGVFAQLNTLPIDYVNNKTQ